MAGLLGGQGARTTEVDKTGLASTATRLPGRYTPRIDRVGVSTFSGDEIQSVGAIADGAARSYLDAKTSSTPPRI
jgi:hypothetical protein